MKTLLRLAAGSPATTGWLMILLIRLHVGAIFILAGYRKFTEPAEMGTGRFEEMGLPMYEFLGPWVGFWELFGGALVLVGLLTRAAAIPLVVTMVFALYLTKLPNFADDTLVNALHSARLDFALLCSSLFLVFAGGGGLALDRMLPLSRS